MPIEIPKDKWPGKIRTVTLGATSEQGGSRGKTVTLGGASTLPFMNFEAPMPHPPQIAFELRDRRPDDWSAVVLDVWGGAADDPAVWARAAEEQGADLLQLSLSLTNAQGNPTTPQMAVAATRKVLESSSLPLMVYGPGQAEADNELLVAVAEATKGERLALGICEDKNYRTIVAAALANDHLVVARAPMDVNLSKQLNILITDMGLPPDRILMDPTCGALGYGIEYGYSVMERLRLAALQGDSMTQNPMTVSVGFESWKTKEAKVGADVPSAWGEWTERGIQWETLTAVTLLEAGADLVILRHPESLRRVRLAIQDLASIAQAA
ncbi:MAG: acetyl-CoA decarbonylase/synthase complex subunit delta [Chloroflexi bacterium]|nr:acetyl-CoA decarbonylase/synthase complex subunit delta [Chloroflexota bacterium]